MRPQLTAVPNLSMGCRSPVELPGSPPLDFHCDPDHGRAVVTFGDDVEDTMRWCYSLAEWALAQPPIDAQLGVHPRFGILDVLPLVPHQIEEDAVTELAVRLGSQIVQNLKLPVYTYGRADERSRSLPELRRYLRNTPHETHPTAGVVCLGIRDPLVAFNVNFRGDIRAAKRIAGKTRATEIRALGFELASRGLVQVSMNLIEPDRVGPKAAFDRVIALARDSDLELVDCEIVGLVPHPILEQLGGLPLRAPVRSIEQAMEEKGLELGRP